MAGRSNTELKVFLNGSLTDYQNFCKNETDKQGSVFFDHDNKAVYVEGVLASSSVKNITYVGTLLTITLIDGSSIPIELSVEDDLKTLKTTLENWVENNYVKQVAGSRLMTDGEGTKLANIEPNAEKNKYNTIEAGEDESLLTTVPVDNVKLMGNLMSSSEDDILGGKVAYNFSASYDNAKHKIYFFNTAGVPDAKDFDNLSIAEIDATQFIKDGVVDNVTYDPNTKTLTISFNTSSGINDVPLDLTGLVDTYTAGNGLTVVNNQFSAKLGDGLEIDTYKNITVKYNPNGGITVNAAGVALKAATNGGITVGASGAAVDWSKAPLRTVNGETIADGNVDTRPKVWSF